MLRDSEVDCSDESQWDTAVYSEDESPDASVYTDEVWRVIEPFLQCRGEIATTFNEKTYDLSELKKYARKEPEWLNEVSMQAILAACARRHGKLAKSWRHFRTFEIAEEYCAHSKQWTVETGLRELIQNWYKSHSFPIYVVDK